MSCIVPQNGEIYQTSRINKSEDFVTIISN